MLPGKYYCGLLCGLLAVLFGSSAAGADPEDVSFPAGDNVQIFADYYPPLAGDLPAPMVILLHMYKHDRTTWKPLIGPLRKQGFAILAIDMRGHGESATADSEKRVARRDPKIFEDMYEDVRGAYDWLAQQQGVDRSRFALVGASVGCSVALRYAVQDKSVDAIVCMTPGEKYLGLDSTRDMRQIRGREILLMATEDEITACNKLKPLSKGSRVRTCKGRAHGTNMFGVVPGVEDEIASFLKQTVGSPTDTTVYGSIRSHIYHPKESGWIERISPSNLRYYSSPKEAEARGLRKTKSLQPRDERDDKRP